MSFRLKIFIGLALIQLILLGLLIVTSMSILNNATEKAARQRGNLAAELFASMAKDSILSTDFATLDSFVNELLKQEGVLYVRVLNRQDIILTEGFSDIKEKHLHEKDSSSYDVITPVMVGRTRHGEVQLGFDVSFNSSTIVSAWKNISLIAIAELVLTILFTFFLSRYLTRQLGSLVKASQALANGNMSYRLPIFSDDELGQTASAFNIMAALLEKQQKDLENSEERLKLALEGTKDGLWDWDIPSGNVYFSPRFETMLGYAPGELVPHVSSWEKMVHPDDIEEVMEELKRHLIGEVNSYQTEHRVINKQGKPIWILDRGKVVKCGEDGTPIRAVGIHTDITSRKAMEQERKNLIQAIEQSPVSIMLTDPNGCLEYVNPHFESLTGYAMKDVVGMNPKFLQSGYHDEAFYEKMWQSILETGKWNGEIYNRKKNGEKFWELVTISSMRDNRGTITNFLGIKEDITERKQVMEALHDSTEKLARAQQIAHIGNWEWNIQENKFFWSEEVERMFALETDAKHEYDVYFSRVHAEDLLKVEQKMDTLLAEGDSYDFEHRIVRPNGEVRVVQEIGKISRNEQGEAVFVTGTVQDITERKKAERLKNEFVSTVSHELRTPLTSIYGGLKMVLAGVAGELPDKIHKLVALAFNNSERLNLLINDLLDIQKIEAGQMSFKFQPVDVLALVRRAIDENTGYAEKFKVSYSFADKAVPQGLMINGDENRLCQVLANFLSNAVKYSEPEEVIEIRVEMTTPWITFSVTDHGTGIPKDFQPKVFEKFAQADSSDTRKRGGTGLGLSVCKALVESHNGEIGFKTKLGEGTTFFFRLPMMKNGDSD